MATKQLRTAVTAPTHLLTSDGTADVSNIGYSTPTQAQTTLCEITTGNKVQNTVILQVLHANALSF